MSQRSPSLLRALRTVQAIARKFSNLTGIPSGLLLTTVPAVVVMLQWMRRRLASPKQVQVYFNARDARAAYLVQHSPALQEYSPPFWMNGHVQTLWGAKLRPRPPRPITFSRKWLRMGDGGAVALDWHTPLTPGRRTMLLLHGLTGGSQENYIQHMTDAAAEAGWTVVVLIARGCSGTPLVTSRGFAACWTADVRAALVYLRQAVGPHTPLFAAGFSLGATILSRYLVEEGGRCPLQGAALLCPTLDLHRSTHMLEGGVGALTYSPVLAGALVNYAAQHTEALGQVPGLDLQRMAASRTVRQFDSEVVVPGFGFDDVWHYYRASTTCHLLAQHVDVPTLVAHAADDPICSAAGIPTHAPEANANLVVAMTQEGGHVAWLTGTLPRGRSWVEQPLLQFAEGVLQWNAEHGEPERTRQGAELHPFTDPIHPTPAQEAEQPPSPKGAGAAASTPPAAARQ